VEHATRARRIHIPIPRLIPIPIPIRSPIPIPIRSPIPRRIRVPLVVRPPSPPMTPRAALALALLLASPAAVAAGGARTTALLLPATGSNVPEPQLAAASDILRAYLESTGRLVVVRSHRPTAPDEFTAAEAADAARGAGAAIAVTLHVSRLADTGLARVAAYASDGTLLHSDQLGVLGADDLDPALRRLADGVATGRLARNLAEIDTVTAREEAPLKKMKAYMAGGLKLGATMPVNRPDPGERFGSAGTLGLVWYYDARDWIADVSFEGFTSAVDPYYRPDRGLAVAMGVYLPLSKGNASPYLGVGAAWAVQHVAGETGSGIQGRAMAGVLLGRLSDVAVRLEAGYFLNGFPLRDPATGRDVHVQGATASLVLVAGE
jgi:hypothetical protein